MDLASNHRAACQRTDKPIAALLRAAGVQAGDRVAILRTRSIETVAAMLGVLEAGAAFVPVDPAWPATSIAFVLENAGASLALVEPGSVAR